MKCVYSLIAGLALTVAGHAQSLQAGSPAPSLKSATTLKGKVPTLGSGRPLVVEFWATWCGPCIEAMPHLSQLADKYGDRFSFFSINVRDRPIRNGKPESRKDQLLRVKSWVSKNEERMRYSVGIDDEKSSLASTWLEASNSPAIPRVFVVDGSGRIAWIGHPNKLEAALLSVLSGTNDTAANNAALKKESSQREEMDRARADFGKAIENSDADAFDTVSTRGYNIPISSLELGLQLAALRNPTFALNRLNHYAKVPRALEKNAACLIAGMVAKNSEDSMVRTDALKLSAKLATENRDKFRVYGYLYHAQTLRDLGDTVGSDAWLDRLEKLKSEVTPERWASIMKTVEKMKSKN